MFPSHLLLNLYSMKVLFFCIKRNCKFFLGRRNKTGNIQYLLTKNREIINQFQYLVYLQSRVGILVLVIIHMLIFKEKILRLSQDYFLGYYPLHYPVMQGPGQKFYIVWSSIIFNSELTMYCHFSL